MTLLILGALCVGVAAIIGGATGFGSALVATPLMLLVGFPVTQVVALNLAVGLATRATAAVRLRREINWRRVALLGFGSVPGALLGAATVSMLPVSQLKSAVGVLVVVSGLAMALPTRSTASPPSSTALTVTGSIGGYLAATTSLNGPPPVLLLMRARIPPLSFIADLAGYFIVANVTALAILWMGDSVTPAMLWPALPLFLCAALIGNGGGLWIARRLPTRIFRSLVIALVVAAGIMTVVTA
ncbi:hypothetical protein GCM10023094_21600 [Rhodococcus olei]|uniref:Probable membrane transporter protein n=1 Tax=Rhodococcus olei TaxID=2161675 RepID=A0ABP8NYX7_9NOCA